MRKALAALTLSVVAFVTSIFPALAQDESDLYGDAIYDIPASIAFGDGVYGTTLALSFTAILALFLVSAILALAIMNRSDKPRR